MQKNKLVIRLFRLIWYMWACFICILSISSIIQLCIDEKTVIYLIMFPMPLCSLIYIIDKFQNGCNKGKRKWTDGNRYQNAKVE